MDIHNPARGFLDSVENYVISKTYSLIIYHFPVIIFVFYIFFIALYTIQTYNKRYKKERKSYKIQHWREPYERRTF